MKDESRFHVKSFIVHPSAFIL